MDDCNLISEAELEKYAYSIASLDPFRVLRSITSLRDRLRAQGADLLKPCSSRDDGTSCWVVDSLLTLNKHLTSVHTEIEEYEPGKLAVTYIDAVDECDDLSDRTFLDCVFLICWLLRNHRCIKRVCLCESVLVRTNPAMLGKAIELAPGLVEVDIKCLFISTRASVALASALSHKVGLEKLHLSSLLVDHVTARDIACALKKSRVQSLVLYNGLSMRAGDVILRAVGKSLVDGIKVTSGHLLYVSITTKYMVFWYSAK
ncbi:protein NLRC3 isoform X2 [Ixodes scapularis]